MPHERAGKLVVIARHKHYAAPFAGTAQQFLHHIVVRLWPEPSATQLPPVHDISHEIQRFAGVVLQKIQQGRCLAAWRSQVQIGNKHGPETIRFWHMRFICVAGDLRHSGGSAPSPQGVKRRAHQAPRKCLR